MNSQSLKSVTSTTHNNSEAAIGIEEDDFLSFQRDFEVHFENLANAIAKSNSVGSVASTIGKKGTLSMIWGSVNGGNDKEFAQMAGDLAASLATTQVVVQMIMQLNHRKNGFLREFQRVLADKISNLMKDDQTLGNNQREAALAILQELDKHVAGQIEQQEMVSLHEKRLERLDQYVGAADLQSADLHHRLSFQELAMQTLSEANQQISGLVDAQRAAVDAHRARLDAQEISNDAQHQSIAGLEERLTAQKEQIEYFSGRADEQRVCIDTQRTRIDDLEATIARLESTKALLLRNAPSFAALALAAMALLRAAPSLGA